MLSLSSKEYLQATDTNFIQTLDVTRKINFPYLNNLTLSQNQLQKNDNYFLRKSPNVIFDLGKEVVELPQVPENVTKKKTVRPGHDTNTFDNVKNKYYSRHLIDNLKIVVKKWLKIFSIKKKDEFGANNTDVYNYMLDKLEPITLDRANSETDYKKALKLNITVIVNELSLFDIQNSNVIDTLVNEIIAIDGKIPIRYIQPTDSEIKQFIKDEIIFVLEKSRKKINSPKMEELENNLIDHLLDLTEIDDINDQVIDQISRRFQDIAKISGDKAKYFTKIILNDYKEFFFRQNFFSRTDNKKLTVPNATLGLSNRIDSTLMNQRYFEQYINQIAKEIKKWFTDLNVQVKDSEVHIKELTCDIIDRQKFLAKYPNMKGTISEELEHLKYQIYKRTCKFLDENALEHVESLIKRMNFLPSFSLDSKFLETQTNCSYEVFGPVIVALTNLIESWFHKLPIDMNSVGDTSFNRQLIRILAEDIEECINNNKQGTIDTKIDKWVKEIFKNKLSNFYTRQLKNKILMFVKNNLKKLAADSKRENNIRTYKSIINDWINTFSLQCNKEDYFVCNRYKYVHELATKIYDTMNEVTDQSLLVDIYNTLREDILEWMKILPLDDQSNKCRDKYAVILVTNIKFHHIGDANTTKPKQSNRKFLMSKLENAMLDCIINAPENTKRGKDESYTLRFNDILLYHSGLDDSLEASVEAWLNKLPIHVTDFVYFKIKKNTFIENIKLLRALGATDEVIINEIIKFMKTLPMAVIRQQDNTKKEGEVFLEDNFLNIKSSIHDDTSEMIEFTIQKWAERLSVPSCNTKKITESLMTSLIDKVVPLICELIKQIESYLNDKNSQTIRNEIINFLDKFPQKRIPEKAVILLSKCLTRKLKALIKTKVTPDIITFGTIERTEVDNDEINDNLEIYAAQIVNEISNWLNKFLRNENDGFNVILNDLADDILDKDIYLKLNPQCQRNSQDEMERLQFEIFKGIDKLNHSQEIDRFTCAQDFVQQGKNISVGIFAKDSQVFMQSAFEDVRVANTDTSTVKRGDNNLSNDGKSTSGLSFREMSRSKEDSNRNCTEVGVNYSVNNVSYHNPKEVIFEKYQKIFKDMVSDLPIYAPTPESEQLSNLARTGIYNAIMKTFFTLKSDHELENDYGYFELILEDKLDEMLDLLPQTEDMKKFRHGWKVSILSNALNMLKEMQDVSDKPSFRQRLKDGFNRKFAKNFELEQCFLLQQGFLAEMAEAYILETKYKEDDPLKANIYKQRLMKKVDEMANHLTRQHNVDFRYLRKPQLIQHAMKILADVPIPKEDILNDEVEEILLAEEIEQWYKELPVTPYINDFDKVFRKRMMDILAQKIHEIEKNHYDFNDSKDREIKHEISIFLTDRGRLERDKDLNINFMVEELNNRLKNRHVKDTTNYDAFENKKPVSSSFAKLDNTEILSPLIDASTDAINQSYLTRDQHSRLGHGPTFGSNQMRYHGNVCGPPHQNIRQDQLLNQQPVPYSNGIPFQWPADSSKSMQNVAQDSQVLGAPRADPAHYNPRSSSPQRGYYPKNNLEMNRVNRHGRQRENSQEAAISPNQSQYRTSPRIDPRGTKPMSPKYLPESAQGYTNGRRPTYCNFRGTRSASPCRNNRGNFKPKPDLDSNYLRQRQARKRTSPPPSANANQETNRTTSHGSQKPEQSRMGIVIPDDQQNQNTSCEDCMPQGIIRCHPNCKQITHRGKQEQAEQSNRPKIVIKCECDKDFNKVKCMCFDSQPCPCKLIIKPCHFY